MMAVPAEEDGLSIPIPAGSIPAAVAMETDMLFC